MGNCLPCIPLTTVGKDGQESDQENTEFRSDHHGSRPEEWRMWMADTLENRQVFDTVTQRMNDFMKELARESNKTWKGFEGEVPRVDQYFLAGPKVGPKAATRNGAASMEVKELAGVSEYGSEAWEKVTGADISTYTRLPWVSLKKSRKRAKVKKIAKDTYAKGLKALEVTEIEVSQENVYSATTASSQPLKHQAFLTIAVEGKPDAIDLAVNRLKLKEFMDFAFLNPDASAGLYSLNVSYPRFLSLRAIKV